MIRGLWASIPRGCTCVVLGIVLLIGSVARLALAGPAIDLPHDFGSHPEQRSEWWYVTGWLSDGSNEYGFQVTFFRVRMDLASLQGNPSSFAARQILIAHAAFSDPSIGHLLQAQRTARTGLQLAEASIGDTHVFLDDWSLTRAPDGYHAHVLAEDFELQLRMQASAAPLLNGSAGISFKGPAKDSYSHYYSEPQLRVVGKLRRQNRELAVTGLAWLDHEWSNQYLDPRAAGWDWTGINFDDGSAMMAFRIRALDGSPLWAAATWRNGKLSRIFDASQVKFTSLRVWRSSRTGIGYPVAWRISTPQSEVELQPLFDDQENDTRASTGAIYWEGAVRAMSNGRAIGRGYLELTGYGKRLQLP